MGESATVNPQHQSVLSAPVSTSTAPVSFWRGNVAGLAALCLLLLAYGHQWQHSLWTPATLKTHHTDGVVGAAAVLQEGGAESSSCPLPEPCVQGAAALPVALRRRLAFTMAQVQRHISRLRGTRARVDGKWAVVLRALLEELSQRTPTAKASTWDHSAMVPGPTPPNGTRHVCPEVYYGKEYGHPFCQHGVEPTNCTDVPKFSSVLSVVLPARSWEAMAINFVITQIRKVYDVPIIAVVPEGAAVEGKDVDILRDTNKNPSEAELLNRAVKRVRTPYVFLASRLAHFSNQSSLERMVRVLEDLPLVQVVGGAARDLMGRWTTGCLQQRMADYQATYTLGYYHSKNECMYCDDLLTPFASKTELVRNVAFTAGLSGPAMYRDWFAQVRQAGHLAMVCPDAMFFVSSHVNMTWEQWLPMARRWDLEKVHSYTGEVHTFSCDSVGISCRGALGIIRSFLLPPCCRATMERELHYLIDYAEANNLDYELHSGSVLGAVKMGSYLPWDFDQDILFVRHEYKKWLAMRGSYLRNKRCSLTVNSRNVYLTVYCPFFFLELYSSANFTSREFLPHEYKDIPTSITYAGRQTVVMSNPGLYVRNKVGIDDLKHAAHWRTLRVTSVGRAKGGYEVPGTWRRCRKPDHHSCQDRYPGDGDLPFLRPFLHP